MAFDEEEHLGDGEQTDDGDKEINAVIKMQVAPGQTRQARRTVDPDHCDAKTDTGRHRGFRLVVRGHAAQRAERQQIEGEILGRAEQKRHPRQRRRQQHQPDGRQKSPDERGNARQHQRIARATLLWPSGSHPSVVINAGSSPGMFSRIELIRPPYIAP